MSTEQQDPDFLALNDAIEKSKRWMHAVHGLVNGIQFDTTLRGRVVISLHHLCIEHHTAIHTLVDHHVWGSAFALMRPQLEAYVRGVWCNICATEEGLIQFCKDERRLDFGKLVADLEASGKYSHRLRAIKETSWSQLCGWTHGGAIQLSVRNTMDEIATNFKLTNVTRLITSSVLLSAMACAGIGRVVRSNTMPDQMSALYEAIYGEPLLDPGSAA